MATVTVRTIERLRKEREDLRIKLATLQHQVEEVSTNNINPNLLTKQIEKARNDLAGILDQVGYGNATAFINSYIKSKHQTEVYESRIDSIEEEINGYEDRLEIIDQAKTLLQATAEAKEYEIKAQVEALVTRGLRAVFGRPDYRFSINLVLKRGRLSLEYWWEEQLHGETIKIPLKAQSGGVIDVTVVLLRIVFLSLFDDKAKFIALDEPFKHLSSEYIPAVATLLKRLRDLLGLQIILITHKEELSNCGNKIFVVRKINEETKVKEI